MDRILVGPEAYAAAYIDDVVIRSNTWEDSPVPFNSPAPCPGIYQMGWFDSEGSLSASWQWKNVYI